MPGNGRKVSLYLPEKGGTIKAIEENRGLLNKSKEETTVQKHEGLISNFYFLISAYVNAYQFF